MLVFDGISTLGGGQALDTLSGEELGLLQRALNGNCYKAGPVDGLIGRRTRTAYSDFVRDIGGGDPDRLEADTCRELGAQLENWRNVLAMPAGTKVEVTAAVVAACKQARLTMRPQIAYVLATVEHETAQSYRPVREAYYLSDGGVAHRRTLAYSPFYGRGYVQLTHETNYKRYADIVGVDMVDDPDLALRHDVALFVLVQGMKIGGFTAHKLEDHIRNGKKDYINARRVISGTDKADEIAAIATRIESRL